MDTFLNDLRYGFRALKKNPGFTIIAILALSLGIAVNTSIFSVVHAVLIQPLPFADPDRVFMMWEKQPQMEVSVAYPNFLDWREQSRTFQSMAAFRRSNMNLTGTGEPERLSVRMVSADFFQLLGVQPALGRDFRKEEDERGKGAVAVLSYGLWQRQFGSNSDVIGKRILLDEEPYTVIGVAPEEFQFGSEVDVYSPIGHFNNPKDWTRGSHPGIYVIGRLKTDATQKQMKSEMQTIASRLAKQYPETNSGSEILVQSLRDNVVGDVRPSLLLLTGAVALVLLIACANVANMMLARSTERIHEVAIRASLGASRGRIIRQVLTESFALTFLATIAGLLLANWGIDLLAALRPDSLPTLNEISMNRPVLLFTVVLSVLSTFLLGLLPAFRSARPDLIESLKESSKLSAGQSQKRLLQMLVVSEVALASVLLIAAGLLARSFVSTQNVDPGFRPEGILTMRISLPVEKYKGTTSLSFFQQLEEKIRALPEVKNAAISTGLPIAGAPEVVFYVEGRPEPKSIGAAPQAVLYVVSPTYFETMGIRLLKGRTFSTQDTSSAPFITMVDETLMKKHFADEEILGRRMSMGPGSPQMDVVGVVNHVKHYSLDSVGPVQAQMYFPLYQVPEEFLHQVIGDVTVTVRTTGDPLHLVSAIRSQVQALDPVLPVFQIQPMNQWIDDSISSRKFAMTAISVFACMALLLALVGVYGVMTYSVVQRTREIGIRVALGASSSGILSMILKQGLTPVIAGLVIGAAVTLGVSHLMAGLLFGVTPRDPVTFTLIPLMMILVAIPASYIPARRALQVDPLTALRYE